MQTHPTTIEPMTATKRDSAPSAVNLEAHSKESLFCALQSQERAAAVLQDENAYLTFLVRSALAAVARTSAECVASGSYARFNSIWNPLLAEMRSAACTSDRVTAPSIDPLATAAMIDGLNGGVEPVGRCSHCGGPVVCNAYPLGGGQTVSLYQCWHEISREEGAGHGWSLGDSEVIR